ncbi:hypothetical protein A5755_33030 [Mycolicibacterium fortuitum]|nr:hypothetical protein A5754_13490 [Mycolicibacterium fortuitum]OBB52167.1 hypothetical protein A5755_33030 [Mycolicibacterium fortuitum]OBF79434.1 hypothetical protein A5751_19140 [Mycolicibacterium fortuitum]
MRGLMKRAEIKDYLAERGMADVAEYLIIRADRRGEIPCIRIGRNKYYSPEDIDAWVAAHRHTPKSAATQHVMTQ